MSERFCIENKLLREKFNDPRVHFVLVCGAIGCPPLINYAYRPDTLEKQLDAQTRSAINGNFIKVHSKKKKLEVSEIMKWYRSDFIQNGTTEIDFINTYRNEKLSEDPADYANTSFDSIFFINLLSLCVSLPCPLQMPVKTNKNSNQLKHL